MLGSGSMESSYNRREVEDNGLGLEKLHGSQVKQVVQKRNAPNPMVDKSGPIWLPFNVADRDPYSHLYRDYGINERNLKF